MTEEKAAEVTPEKSDAEQQQDAFVEELTREPEKKVEEKTDEKETPEKAPEVKPEPAPAPQVPVYTDDDKALLKAYDFDEADANPKLMTALRKAEKDRQQERARAEFFGKSNKEMSVKLKAFARAEATSIDSVKEKIKGRLSKIPKDKLSEHTRNLLEDPAYLEAQAAMEVARMTEEEPEKDDSAKEQPAYSAELGESAVRLFDEVKKVHPDIKDIYAKPEFYTGWLKKQPEDVQRLYFQYDASAHINLANKYKEFLKAEQVAATLAVEKDKGADAFAGHGETGSARRAPEKELTPEEEFQRMMSMSDDDFKKEDKRVLSGGRR